MDALTVWFWIAVVWMAVLGFLWTLARAAAMGDAAGRTPRGNPRRVNNSTQSHLYRKGA